MAVNSSCRTVCENCWRMAPLFVGVLIRRVRVSYNITIPWIKSQGGVGEEASEKSAVSFRLEGWCCGCCCCCCCCCYCQTQIASVSQIAYGNHVGNLQLQWRGRTYNILFGIVKKSWPNPLSRPRNDTTLKKAVFFATFKRNIIIYFTIRLSPSDEKNIVSTAWQTWLWYIGAGSTMPIFVYYNILNSSKNIFEKNMHYSNILLRGRSVSSGRTVLFITLRRRSKRAFEKWLIFSKTVSDKTRYNTII